MPFSADMAGSRLSIASSLQLLLNVGEDYQFGRVSAMRFGICFGITWYLWFGLHVTWFLNFAITLFSTVRRDEKLCEKNGTMFINSLLCDFGLVWLFFIFSKSSYCKNSSRQHTGWISWVPKSNFAFVGLMRIYPPVGFQRVCFRGMLGGSSGMFPIAM